MIHRMSALLGHSQLSKIGSLIRQYRKRELDEPEWYLATHFSGTDHCPADVEEFYWGYLWDFGNPSLTIFSLSDDEGAKIAENYKALLMNEQLFNPSPKQLQKLNGILNSPMGPLHKSTTLLAQRSATWLFQSFIDELLLHAESLGSKIKLQIFKH